MRILDRLGAIALSFAVAIGPVLTPVSMAAEEMVTIDFRDVDISEFVKTISKLTKRNFLLDQGVRGTVTILGPKAVPVSEMWRIFHSVLAIKGLTVVKAGNLYKIVQRKGAKQQPVPIVVGRGVPEISEEPIIQIVPLSSNANDAKNFLTNFISANGELLVHDATNSLIIIDQRDYVARLLKLLDELEQASAEEIIEIIPIEYMAVDSAIKMVTDILKPTSADGKAPAPVRRRAAPQAAGRPASSQGARMVPDSRLNRIIAIGAPSDIEEIKELLSKLDVEEQGQQQKVHVYHLQHADAEALAATLSSIGSTKSTTAKDAASKPANVKIVADKQNNAIIFVADDAEELKSLLRLLEQLDVPKAQVYIQAAIVEVSVNDSGSYSLGLGAGFEQNIFGNEGIVGAGRALSVEQFANPVGIFGTPGIVGGGLVLAEGLPPIGAILTALKSNTNSNVLSTPHLLTSNNEEAEIVVGDNVPFLTGQTATSGGNVISSIDRRDVGLTLRVTPQVNESGMVRLQIYQEISSVSPDAPSGLDVNQQGLITRKRSAKTNVVVKDGQTVAIGGLIGNEDTVTESKVPVLGDIPIIGWLFKSRTKQKRRTNLVIFLTPKVVRGPQQLQTVSLAYTEDFYARVDKFASDDQLQFFENTIEKGYAFMHEAEAIFDRSMVVELPESEPVTAPESLPIDSIVGVTTHTVTPPALPVAVTGPELSPLGIEELDEAADDLERWEPAEAE